MSFYQDRVLPYIIHASMGQEVFAAYRRRVAAGASGCVLEVGVGSGLNIPHYTDQVTHLIGLDPSKKLLSMARAEAGVASRPLETLEAMTFMFEGRAARS
jgi:SAM-dependent methyltransferase